MAALFVGVMPGAISGGQRGLPSSSAAEKITQNKERRREAGHKGELQGNLAGNQQIQLLCYL